MTDAFDRLLDEYDYALPTAQIAAVPASPRDSAKLLVYDRVRETITIDTFRNLAKYLPKNALLIFNDTKVIPARLPCYLPTGGKVELLWIRDIDSRSFEALSPKGLDIGDTLRFGSIILTVLSRDESVYTFSRDAAIEAFRATLAHVGTTPIPPYLKHTPLKERELRTRYQTIFAKRAGSAAAPTASLHFTPRLLASLKKSGTKFAYVTLHVGLGTFAPLTESHVAANHLHEEHFEIPPATIKAIEKAKAEGRPVIAVGTTALRALESAFLTSHPPRRLEKRPKGTPQATTEDLRTFSTEKVRTRQGVSPIAGHTTLFIRPGYTFRIIDGLITNFHVPKSSLLMLVAALVGRETLFKLYAFAIKNTFRFFSFGDGMLIK